MEELQRRTVEYLSAQNAQAMMLIRQQRQRVSTQNIQAMLLNKKNNT